MRPANWDAQAEAWSRRIPRDVPGRYEEELAAKVSRGAAHLAHVETDAGLAGIIVYSVARVGSERELLIIAAFGGQDRRDLTAEVLPEIEKLAVRMECKTVRFHTMRPGLIEKTTAQGFRISEVILRKTVSL